jgi:endonuclease YncB( thermonuclease family)
VNLFHGVLVGVSVAASVIAQSPKRVVFRAAVKTVLDGGVLELEDGRKVGLQGVTLPSSAVRTPGFAARLKTALVETIRGGGNRVWVTPDSGSQPGVDLVASVRVRKDGRSINEELIEKGLAVFTCRTSGVIDMRDLASAAGRAQRKKLGWFAASHARRLDTLPYLNGAVLGLHHQDSRTDYHRQIDELTAAGFQHLCLLFSVFINKVDSVEIRRDHKRTVRDGRLIQTIGYAKKKGMSLMLLPIVLILHPGDDDWRGLLRPKNEGQWWQNYDRFVAHYADICEHTGVDILSIGSELGSLEDRTATWERIIANTRGRYCGMLTYSANWDHAETPRFFKKLDVVGMTAYFSLTKKRDPTVSEIEAEWRRVGKEVQKTHAWHGRPLIFTELGYASQNGINRDPWNYTMDVDAIDLQEQADCFSAFLNVAPSIKILRGAYLYDYYDSGGKGDWSYSPRGKPAMEVWRKWAKR